MAKLKRELGVLQRIFHRHDAEKGLFDSMTVITTEENARRAQRRRALVLYQQEKEVMEENEENEVEVGQAKIAARTENEATDTGQPTTREAQDASPKPSPMLDEDALRARSVIESVSDGWSSVVLQALLFTSALPVSLRTVCPILLYQ